MHDLLIKAIIDAIEKGVWTANSPLSLEEFEVFHGTDALAKRKLAIELVAKARGDFKQQVEALAARV